MITKVIKSLSSREKSNLLLLSFLTFSSILFELFGISLIIPIVNLIFDPTFIDQIIDQYNLKLLREYDRSELITIIVFLFFLIYFIKTFALTYLSYSKFKFINTLIENKTLKLLKVYLSQTLLFHKNNHSSKLVKNLINEMFVLSAFFNSSIILISESAFSILILIGIIIYDYKVFLLIFIYSTIIFIIFRLLFKNKIQNWGNERQKIQADVTKDLLESFGGIKELIIYKKLDYFYDRIKKIQKSKTMIDIKFSTTNEIPKYFIELLALLGFLLIAYSLYLRGQDSNTLLVTLIFLSVIIFKALPSISRIINSVQQIKFFYPAHQLIHQELYLEQNIEYDSKDEQNFNVDIKLKNLTFKYPDADFNILENINFTINKGDRVLIFGKSGKGKSTLLDVISGFLDDYTGDFLIDNKKIKSKSSWRSKIGYLAQSFFILDDTIKNNIILNDKLDNDKLNQVINICNLSEILDNQSKGLNTIIGERGSLLSGGEKQRIGLARALYRNPEILILDEPTSSLDDITSKKFLDSIFELDKSITIIMISHNKNLKERFNKIIQLN